MQSTLCFCGRKWLAILCAMFLLFSVCCAGGETTTGPVTRVRGANELSGQTQHTLSLKYRASHSERRLQDYNDNGYDESDAAASTSGSDGEYTFEDGSTSGGGGVGGGGSGGGVSVGNYQFGKRIDSDEFFHWLEIVGVIVGVVLALTALGFLIYCLLYPFILCCSCVQSEADAFHIIDTYDVAAQHTLSSRPSDSYSLA